MNDIQAVKLNGQIAFALGYDFDLDASGKSGVIISPTGERHFQINMPEIFPYRSKTIGLRDWARDLEAGFRLIVDGTPEANDIEIQINCERVFEPDQMLFRVSVFVNDEPDAIGYGIELAEAVACAGLIYRRNLLVES